MTGTPYIFVYGTLRRISEQAPLAARLRSEADYVGEGKMRGRLYKIDWFPGAVDSNNPEDYVVGDVFRIGENEQLLRALDEFEGCGPDDPEPHEYIRAIRRIDMAGGSISAWAYIYNRDIGGAARISSGDFLQHLNEGA